MDEIPILNIYFSLFQIVICQKMLFFTVVSPHMKKFGGIYLLKNTKKRVTNNSSSANILFSAIFADVNR